MSELHDRAAYWREFLGEEYDLIRDLVAENEQLRGLLYEWRRLRPAPHTTCATNGCLFCATERALVGSVGNTE